jgi:hypothetical protein
VRAGAARAGGGGGLKNLSNWRAVRLWESGVERDVRERHALWLHGMLIGLVILGVMWLAAHLQMLFGNDSLALRYLVTLGAGYIAYLLVLRMWAAALVRREKAEYFDLPADLPVPSSGRSVDSATRVLETPRISSGEGGDFGGGGASADFSGEAVANEGLSQMAGGALEVAAGAEEGAIIVVPVVLIFFIGLGVFLGAGSLLLLYFGWEVLLAVAIELAFSYASARVALRVVREGWLSAAVRLTWKPLAGAMLCAVLLGAAIDYFLPQAHSLPHAIRLVRS